MQVVLELAPTCDEYEPFSQLMQEEDASDSLYFPIAHEIQEVAPSWSEYLPEGQTLQVDATSKTLNFPLGQSMHCDDEVAPVYGIYLPTPQA